MKKKTSKTPVDLKEETVPKDNIEGYPLYPPDEDIYGKCQKMKNINPEDPTKIKESTEIYRTGTNNEKDFTDDFSGGDLDIPGSELDDELESIGSEDEENNFYSLGGDNHNDLDEDQLELHYQNLNL
jgi:hypothetical protein